MINLANTWHVKSFIDHSRSGMSYLYTRYIARKYELMLYVKVIGSRSVSRVQKRPKFPIPLTQTAEHLPHQLASRRPIWSDMTPVDTTAQWREDWQSASVVNYTIVTDPTIRQSGFALPRQSWSLLNRFRTGQGSCRAILHQWGLAKSPTCNCGQSIDYNYFTNLKMML